MSSSPPMYNIDFLSPQPDTFLAPFIRFFLKSQLLPLAAGCDNDAPRGEKKPRPRFLSTRRRNRVLTKIHLIYSVIHARHQMNIQNGILEPGPKRSRGRKIFVPRPIQLLSRGIPPLSPSDSAAFHPNWPPASAHIYPNLPPRPMLLGFLFSHLDDLMNHGKHESWRGLSIFCR